MGAAAHNRGSAVISRQISAGARHPIFALMESLNAMPKNAGAATPFGPVNFVQGHGGWWAECPVTGFGYWYKGLREAVKSLRVEITSVSGATYHAVPLPQATNKHTEGKCR